MTSLEIHTETVADYTHKSLMIRPIANPSADTCSDTFIVQHTQRQIMFSTVMMKGPESFCKRQHNLS